MLQHARYRSIAEFVETETDLFRDMRVGLIQQYMLGDDGSLLSLGYTERPKGTYKTAAINSYLQSIWTHAHVDFVLDPNLLGERAEGP
mmetsp:Transcript_30120/g.65090  ORF Transcript_30120/g.65090 Transcript_30120/m.65090 type:complete len:88 (+) Transcript_30120:470-733(+)